MQWLFLESTKSYLPLDDSNWEKVLQSRNTQSQIHGLSQWPRTHFISMGPKPEVEQVQWPFPFVFRASVTAGCQGGPHLRPVHCAGLRLTSGKECELSSLYWLHHSLLKITWVFFINHEDLHVNNCTFLPPKHWCCPKSNHHYKP